MSPFGFISDGLDEFEPIVDKENNDRWIWVGSDKSNQAMEVWNIDEYGDRSYMWEYR